MQTLPQIDNCCVQPCDETVVQNIPGPSGEDGSSGADGADGVSAFTVLTAAFTMPAEAATAIATVANTSWMTVGQIVFMQGIGYLQVDSITDSTHFVAKNIEDTATGAYASNAAPATVAAINSTVSPAGLQGPGVGGGGALALGGDLKGTTAVARIALNNAIGALPVGNGTDDVSLAPGTDGQVLVSDVATFPATKIGWKQEQPITGDTNVAIRRVARLSAATGLPIPLVSSKLTLEDSGAIRADGSGGNARGTDAVDLQVNRTAVTQVASGARAFIGAGEKNTASSVESVVVGGDSNVASTGDRATVVGGQTNSATGQESFVGGGQLNQATQTQSAICGGDSNVATGIESFVGGGNANVAQGNDSVVGGGTGNQATGLISGVLGGSGALASGTGSVVLGGSACQATASNAIAGGNTAKATAASAVAFGLGTVCSGLASFAAGSGITCSGDFSSGYGFNANAPLYGQRVHSSGTFSAVSGRAQFSELNWMLNTTNATPAEMFLDWPSANGTLRAVIPSDRCWAFELQVVARKTGGGGDLAYWTFVGLLNNVGNAVAMTCAATKVVVCKSGGAAAWDVGVTADDPNNSLLITVTGQAATNINWMAHGRIVELGE
jgi:hypothetical protein